MWTSQRTARKRSLGQADRSRYRSAQRPDPRRLARTRPASRADHARPGPPSGYPHRPRRVREVDLTRGSRLFVAWGSMPGPNRGIRQETSRLGQLRRVEVLPEGSRASPPQSATARSRPCTVEVWPTRLRLLLLRSATARWVASAPSAAAVRLSRCLRLPRAEHDHRCPACARPRCRVEFRRDLVDGARAARRAGRRRLASRRARGRSIEADAAAIHLPAAAAPLPAVVHQGPGPGPRGLRPLYRYERRHDRLADREGGLSQGDQ